MERVIKITDYHQRLNNGHILYDKHVEDVPTCPNPWTSLVVNQFGESYICWSPAWLPKSIGTITEFDNIFDLLNTHEARSIREEILANRYTYCNHKICGYITHRVFSGKCNNEPTGPEDLILIPEDKFTDASILTKLPTNIVFDFDYTCNFVCPSCRTNPVNFNTGEMRSVNKQIVDKIKTVLLTQYANTQELTTIRWAGGEPFVSKAYLELWEFIAEHVNNPNVKNIIQTNGSYIKKKKHILKKFLPYVSIIGVSFDAATEETYNKLRVNGDWNTLLYNCKYLRELDSDITLRADFVMQYDNFREIPEFIKIAKEIGFDEIQLSRMWNWGTRDPSAFNPLNVCDPSHPNHKELLDILNQFDDDKTISRNVF